MLGLLALIGVTFASISGQAQIGARSFAQAAAFPEADQVFDFGMAQLINDTNNPASAIRGHSLKRDMYGNDALNKQYNLDSLPVTLVFDRAGKQVKRFEGFTPEADILAAVKQAL